MSNTMTERAPRDTSQPPSKAERKKLAELAAGRRGEVTPKTQPAAQPEVAGLEAQQQTLLSMLNEVTDFEDVRDLVETFIAGLSKDKQQEAAQNLLLALSGDKQKTVLDSMRKIFPKEEHKKLQEIVTSSETHQDSPVETSTIERSPETKTPSMVLPWVGEVTLDEVQDRNAPAEDAPVQPTDELPEIQQAQATETAHEETIEPAISMPERLAETVSSKAFRRILAQKHDELRNGIQLFSDILAAPKISDALKDAIVEDKLDVNPQTTAFLQAKNKKKAVESYLKALQRIDAVLMDIITEAPDAQTTFEDAASQHLLGLPEDEIARIREAAFLEEIEIEAETQSTELPSALDEFLKTEQRRYDAHRTEEQQLRHIAEQAARRVRKRRANIQDTKDDSRVAAFLDDIKENPKRLEHYKKQFPYLAEELQNRVDEIKREEERKEARRKKEFEVTSLAREIQRSLAWELEAGTKFSLSPEMRSKLERFNILRDELGKIHNLPENRGAEYEERTPRKHKNEEENWSDYQPRSGKLHTLGERAALSAIASQEQFESQDVRERKLMAALLVIDQAFDDVFTDLNEVELTQAVTNLLLAKRWVRNAPNPQAGLSEALSRGFITRETYTKTLSQIAKLEKKLKKEGVKPPKQAMREKLKDLEGGMGEKIPPHLKKK